MENVGEIDENGWYLNYVVKKRIFLGFMGAIVFLLMADPNRFSIICGLPIALCGELLRTWASGVVVKARQLSTDGPYSLMRNPLYLGSYIMAMGIGLMSGSVILFVATAVAFPLVYEGVIRKEEKHLIKIHGDDFLAYCKEVPRWVPDTKKGFPGPVNYDAQRMLLKHGEWRAWLGLLGVVSFMIFMAS
jgi:protein-S-isoprenylcysteine O-methyltransferase Ste14